MGERVEIFLKDDGSIETEVFESDNCEKITEFIDELFGKPASRKMKEQEGKVKIQNSVPSGWCG